MRSCRDGAVGSTCSRRGVLAAAASFGVAACAPFTSGRYEGLRSSRWLGPVRTLAVLEGARVFTEGPTVAPDQTVFFTEMRGNRIMRYSPTTGVVSTFRENSNGANGLTFDSKGRLLVCESALGRITRIELASIDAEVLCERFADAPIADVNDLEIDLQGRIYFTSRPRNRDPSRGNVSALYRLDPGGRVSRLVASPAVEMPNGLAISPDQSTLYLIDSNGQSGGRRQLQAYSLSKTGELSNRRLLYDFAPGRGGDGMCVDRDGKLYVAAGLHKVRSTTSETLDVSPGIHVFSPRGRLLAFRETPEDTVTNCAFGHGVTANTLYVTCGRRLLAIETAGSGQG